MNINELIEKYANESQTLKLHLRRFAIELLEIVKEDSSKALFDPLHKLSIDKALEVLRK